jgi:hypothetical protein
MLAKAAAGGLRSRVVEAGGDAQGPLLSELERRRYPVSSACMAALHRMDLDRGGVAEHADQNDFYISARCRVLALAVIVTFLRSGRSLVAPSGPGRRGLKCGAA